MYYTINHLHIQWNIHGLHSLFDHSTTNPTQFIEEVEMLTRKMSVSSLNCFFINSQELHVYFTVCISTSSMNWVGFVVLWSNNECKPRLNVNYLLIYTNKSKYYVYKQHRTWRCYKWKFNYCLRISMSLGN
jgi:hypothetical protein